MSTTATFHRDGHTLALSLDRTFEMTLSMVCPHAGQLMPKYKSTPECRRLYVCDANGPTFIVRPSCVVQANFRPEAYPLHFLHDRARFDRDFQIQQVPISVEWAMVDEPADEPIMTSLYLNAYYQARDRHGDRDFAATFSAQVGKVPAERMRVEGEVRA